MLDEWAAIVDDNFRSIVAMVQDKARAERQFGTSAPHRLGVVALAGARGIVVARHYSVARPVNRGNDRLRPSRRGDKAKHRRKAAQKHCDVGKPPAPLVKRDGKSRQGAASCEQNKQRQYSGNSHDNSPLMSFADEGILPSRHNPRQPLAVAGSGLL